jgi:apolipoprotein N-acyltransferase
MEQLDALAAAIEAAPPGLVVTPETAFPLTVDDLPPSYLERLQAVAQRPGTALLWGSFTGDAVQGYMNSMLGMTGGGSGPYVYGKRHLLPFGETIPPGFRGFVRAMNIPMDDQARGQHDRPFFALGQGLRPLICFEDLFAEEIAHSVAQGGATVLVNASNLAWFGRWMVQDQHLQFSIMRALEFQRPVVRSTNTGSTAVVDHRGQVLARLPPEQRASLSAVVEGRQGVTPLAWWMSRAGLWPLWVLGSLGLLGPLGADGWARRRALPHRHPHPHPAD